MKKTKNKQQFIKIIDDNNNAIYADKNIINFLIYLLNPLSKLFLDNKKILSVDVITSSILSSVELNVVKEIIGSRRAFNYNYVKS